MESWSEGTIPFIGTWSSVMYVSLQSEHWNIF
jgi:hypothetical protein